VYCKNERRTRSSILDLKIHLFFQDCLNIIPSVSAVNQLDFINAKYQIKKDEQAVELGVGLERDE